MSSHKKRKKVTKIRARLLTQKIHFHCQYFHFQLLVPDEIVLPL